VGRSTGFSSIRVRFGTVGDYYSIGAMPGSAGDLPALFFSGRLDNSSEEISGQSLESDKTFREFEASVSSVTIKTGSRTITLQLGTMSAPMAAMRTCTSDLVKLWGLDPEQQAALTALPRPRNISSWQLPDAYPKDSLMVGQQAIVRVRLMVDAAGEPTSCTVQSAIAKGDFAKATCDQLMRNARFEPALDANNVPTPSYFVTKLVWRIQG
jgi:hypothetical protein